MHSRTFAAAILFATATMVAQCGTQVLPGDGSPGPNGTVHASATWDPDGPGPAPVRLVIAGDFTVVGSTPASRIAVLDPNTGQWSSLGSGLNLAAYALLALPNGDLVAGGAFTVAGGNPANWVARWSGGVWSPIGAGLPVDPSHYGVLALAQLQNGDLVAGGNFYPFGSPRSLARWNGSTWAPLGGGIGPQLSASVSALRVASNGDLIVGGSFNSPANNIARWDGTNWSPFGTGTDGDVLTLQQLPNGTLIAGGSFSLAGGSPANRIASWNGAWSPLGSGMSGQTSSVRSLTVLANGDLVAGGRFDTAGGAAANHLARWNGSSWSNLGSAFQAQPGIVLGLVTLPSGALVASGFFQAASVPGFSNLAQWNGSAWSGFGIGMNGWAEALARAPNGDLIVGGYFTSIGNISANHIARRTSTGWQPLGTGTDATVKAVAMMPNGDVVAGGQFLTAGGVAASGVARWNGSSWSALGSGVAGTVAEVKSLAVGTNGDLFVGGNFATAGGIAANRVARWDGSNWSALGSGVSTSFLIPSVAALLVQPNGDLLVGGDFTLAGGSPALRVARWNGTTWSPLGTGITVPFGTSTAMITSLLQLPNGDVAAGGWSRNSSSNDILLSRWNGVAWTSLNVGLVHRAFPAIGGLATLPNGDLVAGMVRTGVAGSGENSIARWNGSAWSTLIDDADREIRGMLMQPDGTLEMVGYFGAIGKVTSVGTARAISTCPATTVATGSGCSGSGGPNLLVSNLPWLGTTFRSVATGLPANALASSVYGFTQLALPMPTVHPLGQAGCMLWVDDDILLRFVRGSGTVTSELAIPTAVNLLGGVFNHQVIPIELTAGSDIQALTATNALMLTIGTW